MKILVVLYISLVVWMLGIEGESQEGSSAPKSAPPTPFPLPTNTLPCKPRARKHYCFHGTCYRMEGQEGNHCMCKRNYIGKRCQIFKPT
ncbi:protransforming growth factor alpha-like [Oculina patagonica]